ncbi:hypothetical protein Cri9333_4941 (plasmid) [Crinalium epipsammum PCC 9333]|uniref:Uncharacterized protein n=1 Tax=Crinalium epipsammum PCC 9333 TaxID=1173022 RepID=K9W7I3_9CYAN|nr:DUF3987 domain-containing protein [Crinalium epipsammum]AFZ15697.1 hypothetical protein Cri9333_4941 [Crinalium epipsammum PCC 9333]
MVANFKQRLPYQSGKNQPCPICSRTKDGDCKFSETEALCHTHIDGEPIGLNNSTHLLLWKYNGATKDRGWGQYRLDTRERQERKEIRAKSRKEYFYDDRNGNRLIKVTRVDDGQGRKQFYQSHWDGEKWVNGLTDEVKKAVPIYKYQQVRSAIANGQLIFMVEGEGVADALWELGIAATTTLGGSKKYRTYGDYSQDLAGALLVISPDRDECGLEHMEDINQDFPDAQWCYCFPDSPLWQHIPKNTGVDLADWINNDKATATDIMNAVGAKRELKQFKPSSDNSNNNVISHPTATREIYTSEEVTIKIEQFISDGLSGSQLEIQLANLAHYSLYSENALKNIYKARIAEIELSESREEVSDELGILLRSNFSTVKLEKILPVNLAKPITKLATWLNLRPEGYLTCLLTATSTLHKVGTKLVLHNGMGFKVTPNLFAGIVAESSQKKSPILKAMVSEPLEILQQKAREEHDKAKERYERDIEEWNAIKPDERRERFPEGKPQKPVMKRYSYSSSTNEGLINQVQAHPQQGILANVDELAGLLKSANAYRNGRGSDEEDLLSFYDGTGSSVLRADGMRADLTGLLLGIVGTIQPLTIQKMMQDCSDGNGKWARFIFVNQPLAASEMPDDGGNIDLTEMLAHLYEAIDKLPATTYRLSPEAFQYFRGQYNKLEQKRIDDPNPGMRTVWGKTEGRIGKLAINLHVIHELMNGRIPSSTIPLIIMKKAVELAKFYCHQVQAMYSEFSSGTLAPHLAKILQLCDRKQRAVTPRDVYLTYAHGKRPKTEQVKIWFNELADLKLGEVKGIGRLIEFKSNGSSFECNSRVSESNKSVTSSVMLETTENNTWQGLEDLECNKCNFSASPSTDKQNSSIQAQSVVEPDSGEIENITLDTLITLEQVEALPVEDKSESNMVTQENTHITLETASVTQETTEVERTITEQTKEPTTEVSNEVVAVEAKSPAIEVGNTVKVKKGGDRIKTNEIGITIKYNDLDKSFKVKVGDREEGFYAEELEAIAIATQPEVVNPRVLEVGDKVRDNKDRKGTVAGIETLNGKLTYGIDFGGKIGVIWFAESDVTIGRIVRDSRVGCNRNNEYFEQGYKSST